MELNLPSLGLLCAVTGRRFAEGERVHSFLVRVEEGGDVVRADVAEASLPAYAPPGQVVCQWVHTIKPRRAAADPERAQRLTAETLLLELADAAAPLSPDNERLLQFLALWLERQRVLRRRGSAPDGLRLLYEHTRLKRKLTVAAAELSPEFFHAIQGQLSWLVGAAGNSGKG